MQINKLESDFHYSAQNFILRAFKPQYDIFLMAKAGVKPSQHFHLYFLVTTLGKSRLTLAPLSQKL